MRIVKTMMVCAALLVLGACMEPGDPAARQMYMDACKLEQTNAGQALAKYQDIAKQFPADTYAVKATERLTNIAVMSKMHEEMAKQTMCMGQQVKLAASDVAVMKQEVDSLMVTVASLKEEMGKVQGAVAEVGKGMNPSFQKLSGDVDGIKQAHSASMKEHKATLDGLTNKLSDLANVLGEQKKALGALEGIVANVKTLKESVDAMKAKVDTMPADVKTEMNKKPATK